MNAVTREAMGSAIALVCGYLAASGLVSKEVADALKTIALAAIPATVIFIGHKIRRGGIPYLPLKSAAPPPLAVLPGPSNQGAK